MLVLHAVPELAEPLEPALRLIADDEACIDGADRGADDPVGLDARLVQRLIDAALVGAERTAALQHQHHLPARTLAKLLDCRMSRSASGAAVHDSSCRLQRLRLQ